MRCECRAPAGVPAIQVFTNTVGTDYYSQRYWRQTNWAANYGWEYKMEYRSGWMWGQEAGEEYAAFLDAEFKRQLHAIE